MKRFYLLLTMFLLSISFIVAQKNITGKIVDENGAPVIGANILVKGTTTGTISDYEGNYSLSVPNEQSILVFSYLGYLTQEIVVGKQSQLNLTMSDDKRVMEEVVVVGYGTQQRRTITGNVGSIKGDEITSLPVQGFDQAIQGRVAGVNVNIPNGVLNNPPVFRIRGINSINLSSYPLIVIDGVATFTGDISQSQAASNPLSNLNPNDIENIDILKDAAAAAIYGSRASAGVVIITTKRGKQGKGKFTYDGWVSVNKATRLPELLNAAQFVEIKNEAYKNSREAAGLSYAPQFFLDTLNGNPVDTKWSDYIYRSGLSHNHAISFSGATANTSYYLSAGFTNQEGIMVKNTFQRKNARVNIDHKIANRVKLGVIAGISNSIGQAPNTGSLNGLSFNSSGLARIAFNLAPIVPAFKEDGTYNIQSNNQVGQRKNLVGLQWQNPVPLIDNNVFTTDATQYQGNVFAQIDLVKGLYFKTMYGIDNINSESVTFWTPIHGDGFSTNGLASNVYYNIKRWNFQNILNYDIKFNDLGIGLLLGNEQQRTINNIWGISRQNVADPFFTTVQGNFGTNNATNNFQGENYLLSYFGRLNFDFKRIFLATFNLRQDEYSAFAEGNKKGVFWGASAGLAINEFGFWKNSSLNNTINYFRLRGSYGTLGNNTVNDFASQTLFNSSLYGSLPTFYYAQAGNPNLKWETSKNVDVGINFGLLNDRFTGEVTYFNKNIDNLILSVPQSPSKGIPNNTIFKNIGSMVSNGWEFAINGVIIKNRKFSWNSGINLTLMKNEVTALTYEGEKIYSRTADLEQSNITTAGYAVGSLFVVRTVGVNPANGQRIFLDKNGKEVQYNHVVPTGQSRWTYVADGSAAPAITLLNDGVIMGPTLPTYFGTWDNTFRAYGFDLNFRIQYSGGNYIYNGSKAGLRDMRVWNNHTDVLKRWQKPGDITNIPKVVWTDNISNGSGLQISENVEKGDFVRLRDITLGYTIPLNNPNISSARVYFNVNNALLFTKYSGTDPEVSTNGNTPQTPGIDRNTAPMAKSFTFGVNLQF